MKRSYLAIIILALLFLTACQAPESAPENNVVPEANVPSVPEPTQPRAPVLDSVSPGQEFQLGVKEEVMYGSKVIRLESLDIDGFATLQINGKNWVMESTKKPEVVGNLEITMLTINYVHIDPDASTITLKINDFQLGEDEYFINQGKSKTIAGTSVKLERVDKSDVPVKLSISSSEDTFKFNETKDLGPLRISILRHSARMQQYENYVVIKAVPIEE